MKLGSPLHYLMDMCKEICQKFPWLLDKIVKVSWSVLQGAYIKSIDGQVKNLLVVGLMASLCLNKGMDKFTSFSEHVKGHRNLI